MPLFFTRRLCGRFWREWDGAARLNLGSARRAAPTLWVFDWEPPFFVAYTKVSKVVDFRRRSCRSGASPDMEGLTPAGLRLGAYDSESETPALHFRSLKANGGWYKSRLSLAFFREDARLMLREPLIGRAAAGTGQMRNASVGAIAQRFFRFLVRGGFHDCQMSSTGAEVKFPYSRGFTTFKPDLRAKAAWRPSRVTISRAPSWRALATCRLSNVLQPVAAA